MGHESICKLTEGYQTIFIAIVAFEKQFSRIMALCYSQVSKAILQLGQTQVTALPLVENSERVANVEVRLQSKFVLLMFKFFFQMRQLN